MQTLLIAVVAMVAGILIFRILFPGGGPDGLTEKVRELEQQVAAAEAKQDSLDAVVAARDDSLFTIRFAQENLMADISSMEQSIAVRDRQLRNLRRQGIQTITQDEDSLLAQLSDIVREVQEGTATMPDTEE